MPGDVDHRRQRDEPRRRPYRRGHGTPERSVWSSTGGGPFIHASDTGRARGGIRRSGADRGIGACARRGEAPEESCLSVVQRDYLMRMIEQAAAAFAEIAALIRAGDFDLALIVVGKTSDLVLGNLRPVLERLDPTSVVDLIGKLDLDRVRVYAALLAEEGTIRERRGEIPRAQYCFSRALDLYDAISRSGAQLRTADWERIDMLRPKVEAAGD
jgi:hypothetical protein